MYRCIASISKQALLDNLAYIKKKSLDAEIIFMVKANAYGHGLKEIAYILQDQKKLSFGVAAIDEAKILRDLGCKNPIFLFDGGAFMGHPKDLIDLQVKPVITSLEAAKSLVGYLEKNPLKKLFTIHLKIDTGFMRNGLVFSEILEGRHDDFLAYLKNSKFLALEGLATHFCNADVEDDNFSKLQIGRFYECVDYIEKAGLSFFKIHMANSAAILRGLGCGDFRQKYQLMVRPGLAAFGISPCAMSQDNLKTVMQIKAQIIAVKNLGAGQALGYGHSFVAKNNMPVGIVAMGYGDGLRRSLSNRGHMLVMGQKAPIIGTISMDSCAIDLSLPAQKFGLNLIKPGGIATVLGRDDQEEITAKMLAELDGTIVYEMLTSIAERLTRRVI